MFEHGLDIASDRAVGSQGRLLDSVEACLNGPGGDEAAIFESLTDFTKSDPVRAREIATRPDHPVHLRLRAELDPQALGEALETLLGRADPVTRITAAVRGVGADDEALTTAIGDARAARSVGPNEGDISALLSQEFSGSALHDVLSRLHTGGGW